MSHEDPMRLLDKWLHAESFIIIGRSVARSDALDKALGKAMYVEDLYDPRHHLYVKQVLSTIPHGYIEEINATQALSHGAIAVLTARDIPGENQVGYAVPDQPLLAEKKVRYHGEPVALVVAENYYDALEAVDHVEIRYRRLEPVLDPLEALENKILVHEELGSNIAFKTRLIHGDVEKGFKESSVIVENTYKTHHQEHAYLETEGAIAIPQHDGGITVIATLQYPHLGQRIIARVLGISQNMVRVITPYIGGAFGGKDDEGPLVAARAALAAWLLRKPVFLTYTREESIRVHPKREATIIRYRSGADEEGRLRAIDVEIIHDTGAYTNRGPFILWRATVHASGPYRVPNARVRGVCVYTNKVPQGSFRGFGNPSVQFAAEAQMDELAARLGMDPVEIRLKNLLRPGDETITGQVLDHSVGIAEAVEKLAETAEWRRLRESAERYNRRGGRYRRGVGIGVAWHGISTSRGVPDWSNSYVKVERDGSVTVYTGIVEIGQGSPSTSHRQIVAEILGVSLDKVRVVFGTTDAPDTGATHASRGTGVGAIGVLVAAAKIRERLAAYAADLLRTSPDKIVFRDNKVCGRDTCIPWEELVDKAYSHGIEMTATGYFFLPKGSFDNERGQGQAYPAYSYVALITEVEVDTYTGKARVLSAYPALASGRIINPQQVEGQVEGAIVQGLGYVFMEELVFSENGEILNPNLTDYVIPTALDIPLNIAKPVVVEDLFRYGPFGAKGVGEMAFIPLPAAIANAVSHALGKRITELPLTPEKLFFIIKEARREG